MICQSTYDSLDQIPEAFRDEFENRNGKYYIKADAIPGAAEVLNTGLAANRDRALSQLKTATETTIPNLNRRITELEATQGESITPGSVVLSPTDAKTWERYNKLGSVKDVEATMAEVPVLRQKISEAELSVSTEQFKNFGLNNEVLADWLASTKGVSAVIKDGQITDAQGKTVIGKIPFVRVETEDPVTKKITVEDKPLLEYAQTNLPQWKYTALITPVVQNEQTGDNQNQAQLSQQFGALPIQQTQQQTGGVFLPNQGAAYSQGGGGGGSNEKVDYAKQFNEERSKKGVNPFAPVQTDAK